MFEKALHKFMDAMHITTEFDEETLTYTTITYYGKRELWRYEMDAKPLFEEFRKKMDGE